MLNSYFDENGHLWIGVTADSIPDTVSRSYLSTSPEEGAVVTLIDLTRYIADIQNAPPTESA